MKTIGIVGASTCDVELDHSYDYVAIDGGLATLKKQNISPVAVIGDFDSLENQKLLEDYSPVVLPRIKDDTDTAKGIEYAIKNDYNVINLFGVTGGRLDHFFAVICLLKKYRSYNITIYDKQNKIYLLTGGKHTIYKDNYKYLSFFAVSQCQLSISGCFYPLNDYKLLDNDPLCVSNEILEDHATIENSEDLIVVQSNNKG